VHVTVWFNLYSGRRIRHGNPECDRHGGNTRYQPEHIAALARLPQLQLLECAMPSSCESEQLATYCKCQAHRPPGDSAGFSA
jgi:hypothetical protein